MILYRNVWMPYRTGSIVLFWIQEVQMVQSRLFFLKAFIIRNI